jgi:plastocyanin
MHPHRPTLARTVLTASLLLALLASPSVSAQEAVEEPAGEAAIVDTVNDVFAEEPATVETLHVDAAQPPALDAPADAAPAESAPRPLPSPTAPPTLAPGPAPAPAAAPLAGKVAATVVDNRFQPNALTIGVGSTVTWTNNGNNIHTLSSFDGQFDSGGLLGGQSFSFTFDKPGTYRLICRQHGLNGMAGQVVVQ